MLFYLIETEMGWASIAGKDRKISGMEFPVEEINLALSIAGDRWPDASETDEDFSGEAFHIASYFAGKRVDFEGELDYRSAGEFDVRIWELVRSIPYGETRSYGWIADAIAKPFAARAVGQALGRNKIPLIVPCHRVLRSDGGLGGFGLGLEWKKRLLTLEGVSAFLDHK